MVPGFALQGLKMAQLFMLVWVRLEKDKLPFFRDDEQEPLVCQENDLSMPIASLSPHSLAGGKIDATERTDIKTVGKSVVHDHVGKFRSHAVGLPTLADCPLALVRL